MTDIILFVLQCIAFAVALVFIIIDNMHFFQLNSYKPVTQRLWLGKNKKKIIIPVVFSALSLVAHTLLGLGFIPTVILAILSFPKKAKKPLVYTPRVNRMLTTCSVIAVLPVCLVSIVDDSLLFSTAVQALYLAISPVLVLVANFINKPIEKHINNGYIKDAKRILAECPDLKIIGITGSYGKTSVKYYLHTLLQAKYNVLMTPESYNTPMGVVKTIRGSLKATDEIFICEMGARWVGDIKELCDIVNPQHGVITSVGPQHLESFGSLDNVKKTKFELADSLGNEGYLFLNGNDENIKDYGCKRPYISYTVEGDGDYNASNIAVNSKGTTFTVATKSGESEDFSTRLIGRHNVLNIVGAIAIAHTFGVPLKMLKGQVRKLEGVPHRLALTHANGVTIIDDAYNSNPSGSKAALEALSLFEGYKIIVTPGMVELGDKQFELNKQFGKYMADVCDYVVLVGERQAPPMLEGLKEAGYSEDKIFVASTIQQALTHVYALNSMGKEKIILLENDLPDNY